MPTPRRSPSRAIWWFVVTTVPSLVALGWLGRVVIDQDRMLQSDRARTDADRAADLAVAALARTLAEFEQHLSSVAAGASPPEGTSGRAAFILLGPHGVVQRAGLALPYYPMVPDSESGAMFAVADQLEYSGVDTEATVHAIEPLTRAPQAAVKAEAWLRIGRVYRKAGDYERAIAAFSELAALDDVRVQALPAGMAARTGRALVYADTGRTADREREARQLAEDLARGRWVLTESQYTHFAAQFAEWTGGSPPPQIEDDQKILALAAETAWSQWRGGTRTAANTSTATIEWASTRPVFVLRRQTPRGLALMLADASVMQAAWMANLPRDLTARRDAPDVALTDADGRVICGSVVAAASPTVRAASVTRLPWNVHAAAAPAPAPMSSTATLMLAGIGMMALVALGAGYAMARGVSREMRVAHLQSDFVAAVSHEFRTPLTSIRQLSELLARDRVATPERRQEFLDAIVGESERLQRLIEHLLDFGRVETGRLELRFAPVSVAALLSDVVAAAEKDGTTAGRVVDLDIQPELPPVRGDRDALAHVVRNLLDNAVKYSPGRDRVSVSATNGDGRVHISVQDNGLGIPVDEQRDIFQKFVRGAAAASARIPGTGIGLAMVRLIVDAHNGTVAVTSELGKGSTFTVTLPVEAS
jgi:signal transduction histidine kinase